MARVLETESDRLKKLICKDWGYCERRKETGEGLNLAIAVGDCLAAAATLLPIPIASLAVYLVRNRLLDKMCECGE